jgi:hypothetical protein
MIDDLKSRRAEYRSHRRKVDSGRYDMECARYSLKNGFIDRDEYNKEMILINRKRACFNRTKSYQGEIINRAIAKLYSIERTDIIPEFYNPVTEKIEQIFI